MSKGYRRVRTAWAERRWQTLKPIEAKMLTKQLRLSRVNPIDWEIRTPLGTFTTGDRATWCTETDG